MSFHYLTLSKPTTSSKANIQEESIPASKARVQLLRALGQTQIPNTPTTNRLALLKMDLTAGVVSPANTTLRIRALGRLLRVLRIPSSSLCGLRDVIFFQQWPDSETQLHEIVGENLTYTAVTNTSGCAWAYVLGTSSTVGMMWYFNEEGRRESSMILDRLRHQIYLTAHPLALALWSHRAMLTEAASYVDGFNQQVLMAQKATGYHRIVGLGAPLSPEEIDFATLSANISGTAAAIATNRHCLEGLQNMASFVLASSASVRKSTSQITPTDFDRAAACINSQMSSQLRETTFLMQECVTWQTKANIVVQALFNITAQRDQNLSIKIARDSHSLAKASIRDATSMKAIAAVTIFFLPGTFVAVSDPTWLCLVTS